MYEPKQIPYLLDKNFKTNIEYKEYKIHQLQEYCMCIWSMQSKETIKETIYNYILPDACIDIVIDFIEKSICFAGFSKETIPFPLGQKVDYMGVRLKPSSFYLLFGIEATEVMDHPILFSFVEKDYKLSCILTTKDMTERISILTEYLCKKIKGKKDTTFIQVVDELYQNPKYQTVTSIARRFGYNRRHLFRIFKKYYGVSPQVLLNIIRLHLCLHFLLEKKKIEDIMEYTGFYDQSHFIREIKKYTGFSPLELLKEYHE